jgi:DNA-binding winged helix-turn-helix (wHTH) protein/tetratricopeptide (TPR) repeat protein
MTEPAAKSRHAYCFGDFSLDLERGGLWRGADEVKLRPKVFEALRYLVLNPNRLVAKDELLKALWPDSFVTDDSLVQCFVELRRALGDRGQDWLKTVPRRGYVFTASVIEGGPPAEPAAAAPRPAGRPRRAAAASAVLAVVALAALAHVLRGGRPAEPALAGKDSILVADFANTTGDDVFDGTLRQAMAVQLGQSPFLNVISDDRIRETLRYMGRSPDEPVTRDLAREVAQRQGVGVVLAGSIASLGRHYVISLEAVNAATGEAILREQVEAESRERVLGRLGEASARFRKKLGESVGSIEKFRTPIEQATTPSLEAFKAYDLGRRRHFSGQYFEAIPLYKHAVDLDPEFAIAYAALAITYGTAREDDLAARFSERAFALRDRVTERERFYISNRYYVDVLGATDKAIEVMELWKETYPRDFVPRTNLSARYSAIGQHERALEEAREGVRLNPDAGVAYGALAHNSICLDRYHDARAALHQASARKLLPTYGRYLLYGVGFLEGDAAAMQEQVDAVAGTPAEAGMLANQSVVAAYAGQVRRARELTARSIELAVSRDLEEGAGLYSAGQALWEAAYGDCRATKRTADRTLDLSRGRPALSWSALALAMCGESGASLRLVEEMERRFSQDFFLKTSWVPMARAALEIRRGRPDRAVELLQTAEGSEMGTVTALWPAYLRGRAQVDRGAAREALAEFQKILDHRGVLAPKDFNPAAMTLYPLAHVGRARAAALAGDVAESRKACDAFLALWKEADGDIPVLQATRRQCRALEVRTSPRTGGTAEESDGGGAGLIPTDGGGQGSAELSPCWACGRRRVQTRPPSRVGTTRRP